MEKCRHRKSCTPVCPLYVTNDEFKARHKRHCVLEAIWEAIGQRSDLVSRREFEYLQKVIADQYKIEKMPDLIYKPD